MTAKEKAEDMIKKFKQFAFAHYSESTGFDSKSLNHSAKQCALICVDEIIQQFKEELSKTVVAHYKIDYWQQVKTEIQNL